MNPPRVLIPADRLQHRIDELAAEITTAWREVDEVTLVIVLKGGFVLGADLARRIDLPTRIEFVRLESYGESTRRGELRVLTDLEAPLAGKHVLIVDDIVDSGHTLALLSRKIEGHEPASVRRCVLLEKTGRREVVLEIEHVGFAIEDVWAVGYGMDHGGLWRSLPYLGAVDPPATTPR